METNNAISMVPARKSAIAIRREMVKIPAVMSTFSPVDKAIFLASTAKMIAEYDGVDLTIELANTLKWIAKDIGYRDNDDADRQYLVVRTAEILKRYYAAFTMMDFRMAFEMSLTGELDEFLPKGRDGQPERNHYQQFNAEYICRILNAYKARRARVLGKAQEVMPERELPIDPQVSLRCRNQNRQMCIDAYLWYKYHGRLPDMGIVVEKLIYDVLAKIGLAETVAVTTNDQQEIINASIKELKSLGRDREANQIKKSNGRGLEFKAYIRSRRKAIQNTFDWMLEREYQITNYIKFE